MADTDDNKLPIDTASDHAKDGKAEDTRRKLIAKLAAGAFAIPAVLAVLSQTPAHASP